MKNKVEVSTDRMVENANDALLAFEHFSQEQVDKICYAMALAGAKHHMELSKLAVEETGRGVVEDKVIKNLFSTESIWNSIKDVKTVGQISEDKALKIVEIADPIGVVAGVTPVTNPTSTTMFKAIISLKGRNPIIFGFHPNAQKCSSAAARILRDAAIEAGAPKDCIQWIEEPSLEASTALMNHPGVSIILATGGSGLVKAAYSVGKPALGVGPGNVPSYIHSSANVPQAVNDIIISKTFDNGMICASEQAVVVDKAVSAEVLRIFEDFNCHILTDVESKKVSDFLFPSEKKGALNAAVVGQSADWIAKGAGVTVNPGTKILISKIKDVGPQTPLSGEKLSPVLAFIEVQTADEGIAQSVAMLKNGGMGHTAAIHAYDEDVIKQFSEAVMVGRIIVNQPTTFGGIGDVYNYLTPSLTLGCGSYGSNSTTSNVSAVNLINIKRQAKRRDNMQWFKIPPAIYFYEESVQYLSMMEGISRVFIVTDPTMVEFGYVDRVVKWLEKRNDLPKIKIFANVEPDPSLITVKQGVKEMNEFKPDAIIALGGGSSMDAAKGMWMFYEVPDMPFEDAFLKFLDIEKRIYKFPEIGRKAKLICIPTTSGTGSEVTSFSVISDTESNMKYPLADYALTPDVAIIDPTFAATMPASITADTGIDVLTHAVEAYVSIMASDYTDGLALQAIQMVFEYLPRSFKNGKNDMEAREKMHNASAIAGMAFTNAFLGINHSLAHKLGAAYHVPHGRANAILLPHVIRYNGGVPTKIAAFPKANRYVAPEKYAKLARMFGLPASTNEEGVESFAKAVEELNKSVSIQRSLREWGIGEDEFMRNVDDLAEKAFGDQCTTANPRYPLISELRELYVKAFNG